MTTSFESKFATRTKDIISPPSMTFNEKVVALQKEDRSVINMTIGEPDFFIPEEVKEEAINTIKNNFNRYVNSQGIQELREAISKKLLVDGIVVDPNKNILITPGTKQALYYLNCCLINQGDEAIIFEPYWTTYAESVKLCGGIAVPIYGKEENQFKPKMVDLEKKITNKTKYIVFSNPCNPTGTLWEEEELKDIVNLAKKHNVFVIADEIYRDIIFQNKRFVSMASIDGAENTVITINGFSKNLAMTGWRLGYIIAHEDIIRSALKVHQQIATCVNTIAQKAAVVGGSEQQTYISNVVYSIQRKRDLLMSRLNNIKGFSCPIRPAGAFYVFANIQEMGLDSISAAEKLLEEAKIGVVPGIAYGQHCDYYIRFSFALEEKKVEEALSRLEVLYGKK